MNLKASGFILGQITKVECGNSLWRLQVVYPRNAIDFDI
jgi:hypothetical protein